MIKVNTVSYDFYKQKIEKDKKIIEMKIKIKLKMIGVDSE